MEFEKSVIELIKDRKSTRTFEQTEIDSEKLQNLNGYIEKINLEAKIKARFAVANSKNNDGETAKKLGTYGFIKGASYFIVGILDKSEKDALQFGYLFEKIVLFATDMGLQTCWLGGSFKRSDFINSLSINNSEFIPIVSPVGVGKEKRRVFESTMRTVIAADKRKPWSELFFDGNTSTPLDEERAAQYSVPLEMVRLGPSASNKQPWRIIKDKDAFHFFVCRTKGYGVPSYDVQVNDIGIAKCHFDVTANQLGLKGEWKKLESISVSTQWEYICSFIWTE